METPINRFVERKEEYCDGTFYCSLDSANIDGICAQCGKPKMKVTPSEVERKEEVYGEMKYFEVYCLNFSKVIHADSLFSAVLEFVKDHPLERVILAEDTVLFRLAKELTPSESLNDWVRLNKIGGRWVDHSGREWVQQSESQEELWEAFVDELNQHPNIDISKISFDEAMQNSQFILTRRTKPDSQDTK
jgi:hypothetical protein